MRCGVEGILPSSVIRSELVNAGRLVAGMPHLRSQLPVLPAAQERPPVSF
jgi:hypothetical protein